MSILSILIGTQPFVIPHGAPQKPNYCVDLPKSPERARADMAMRGRNVGAIAQGVKTRQMILDFMATEDTCIAAVIRDGIAEAGYDVTLNTITKHLNMLVASGAIEKAEGDRGKNIAAIYWISE